MYRLPPFFVEADEGDNNSIAIEGLKGAPNRVPKVADTSMHQAKSITHPADEQAGSDAQVELEALPEGTEHCKPNVPLAQYASCPPMFG